MSNTYIASQLYRDLMSYIYDGERDCLVNRESYVSNNERPSKVQCVSNTYEVQVHPDLYIRVKVNGQGIATACVIHRTLDGDKVNSIHDFDEELEVAMMQQRGLYDNLYATNIGNEYIQ